MRNASSRRLLRSHRRSCAITALTLTASLLVALPAEAESPAPSAVPTPAPTKTTGAASPALKKAWEQARKSGRRVELPERFTENMKVWAAPDGKRLHAELYTHPIHLKNPGSKTWEPIDTRIVARDGKLQAARVKVPLTFGAEKSKTLVSAVGEHGKVGLATTKALPKPQISGNRITYPNAIQPGVDLVVIAHPNGFLQQVVFRERPADPVTVKLPLTLPKNTRFGKSAGLPQLQDPAGTGIGDPISVVAQDARAESSPDLGKISKVAARIEGTGDAATLVLEPDAAFLADPATAYPVTMAVSSSWIGAGLPDDTFISNRTYPTSQRTATWLRAGKSANGAEYWETYLKFDLPLREFQYATIRNADLIVWNYSSGGPNGSLCGDPLGSGIVARRITSNWSPATLTWSNRPSSGSDEGLATGGYNQNGTGWCGRAGKLWHSIESMVQQWANGVANYGLVLRSRVQSDATNWRQYRSYEGATAPYPDSNHAPAIIIEYEPAERERVVFMSDEPLSTFPSYDEAMAMREILPQGFNTSPITTAQSQALAEQRYVESSTGVTELLPLVEELGDGGSDAAEDGTAPTVVATSPEDGAADVDVDTTITVTFSEEVLGAELTLKDGDGNVVPGTFTATPESDTGGTNWTFTPAQPLSGGVSYTAEVRGGSDIWDNVMSPYSWVFTTRVTCPPAQDPDTTPPAIRSTSPAADATEVGLDSPVSVRFCEPVSDPVMVVKDASGVQVPGTTALDEDGTTVTFTPDGPFTPGTGYTVEITGAKDAAGNMMAAHSWSFVTAQPQPTPTPSPTPSPTPTIDPDTTPPSVTATVPENGARDVAPGVTLRVTYSEPVTGARITVTDNAGKTVAGTVTMTGESEATFTPASALTAGSTYTATASGAADAAGNVQATHTWSFTIAAPAAQPINPNPYFETGLEPWDTYYLEDKLTRTTERAHEGVASAKFVPYGGIWGTAFEFTEVSGGESYQLSGWFYQAETGDDQFDFGIEWYDESYELLWWDDFYVPERTRRWQSVSNLVTAPDDAVYAAIYVGGAGTFYFDEITLVPAMGVALAQRDTATRKSLKQGAPSLYLPPGRTRSKADLAKQEKAAAKSAVTAAASGFDYQHMSLESCTAARLTSGLPYASFGQTKATRYNQCWSKYVGVGEYVKHPLDPERYPPTVEDGFIVEATTVFHTYLGNADGSGVVNGGTSGLRPQNITLWTRLANIIAYDDFARVPSSDLDEYRIGLVIGLVGENGSVCEPTSATVDAMTAAGWKQVRGVPGYWRRDATIDTWRRDTDDRFVFLSRDTDGDAVDTCTIRPMLANTLNDWDELGDDVDDETWGTRPILLWNTGYFDATGVDLGKYTGTAPVGGGAGFYAPTFRCDHLNLDADEAESPSAASAVSLRAASAGTGNRGGCVVPAVSPVFTMSKSAAAAAGLPMDEVIDHIATALDPKKNMNTWPYRTNANGTRLSKNIPGNADAPRNTPAGQPLVKIHKSKYKENRKVFSWERNGVKGECDLYFRELNLGWPSIKHYTDAGLECDEFPFASTDQGAAKANGHYSVRPVKAEHNENHGFRWLSRFYSGQRILVGDRFWVRTLP